MNNEKRLKIKQQIAKRRYKQSVQDFYDEIREIIANNYLKENLISEEKAEEITLLECIQLMPAVKPQNRGCYLLLRELFFGSDMSEKERIWKILKKYKKIMETFEN